MRHGLCTLTGIILSLSFFAGCTAPVVDTGKDSEAKATEDPYELSDFSFTKAIKEIPDIYIDSASQQGSLTTFYYQTKNYDGDLRDETKYCQVYTPYKYDAAKQYNILYLIHGYSGSADDWLGTPEEPDDIKNCIDHLIEEGTVKPMIVVSLTYYDDNTDEETENWDIFLTKQFSQEFINDIMPSVESAYSTYAETTDEAGLCASRSHRMFGGFSMGGVTTWYQFHDSLKYIKYFYPASGSPYWSPDVDGKNENFGGSFAADALTSQGYTKDDFYIYMTTGSEDYARTIVEEQIRSMELYPDIFTFGDPSTDGVNVTYGISDGEDHNYHGRLRDIYTILPVFSQKMNS